MYPRTQRLWGSGGKAKSKGVSWEQRITSFAIVRFGFVVVPRVSLHVFSYGPLVRFVFDALHSSSDLFVILCVSVLVTSLVAKWLFLPLRFILSGS